jgi:hypothetical protein
MCSTAKSSSKFSSVNVHFRTRCEGLLTSIIRINISFALNLTLLNNRGGFMAYIRPGSFKMYIYHVLAHRFIVQGNNSITPRRTVVSEKLIVAHSIAEFPAFSQTQRFINISTKKPECWTLPKDNRSQYTCLSYFSRFYALHS